LESVDAVFHSHAVQKFHGDEGPTICVASVVNSAALSKGLNAAIHQQLHVEGAVVFRRADRKPVADPDWHTHA